MRILFNTMINRYATAGRFFYVKCCKRDVFTFNSITHGLCKVVQLQEAFNVYGNLLLEVVVANSVRYYINQSIAK